MTVGQCAGLKISYGNKRISRDSGHKEFVVNHC
jgi:hypothetical protein